MANEKVFLLPGEYTVKRTSCELATLLGSCVSVTLWHPVKCHSAMCHFLLANNPGHPEKGRYGDTAIELIITTMSRLDSNTKALRAGIYGGGAVTGHLGSTTTIGERNIDVARNALHEAGIKVVEEHVGGEQGRRIYMDSMTGVVRVAMIAKSVERDASEKRHKELSTRKLRVLIVDDSMLVRKILRKAIEEAPDMEVCGEAGDAFEARNMILQEDPDVISLDIIMPKMSGLDFLKKLSSHYPKPVVICSTIAKTGSDIAERAKQYGAIHSVDKDKLEIYNGMGGLNKEYIPRLRDAAGKVVAKKLFAN